MKIILYLINFLNLINIKKKYKYILNINYNINYNNKKKNCKKYYEKDLHKI